jgi:hypothetical protein
MENEPSRNVHIKLRDSNPVKGEMFIELARQLYLQFRQERYVNRQDVAV